MPRATSSVVDLLLRHRGVAGRLARRRRARPPAGARSSSAGDASRSYTTTSARRSSSSPRRGQQAGITGAGTDEVHGHRELRLHVEQRAAALGVEQVARRRRADVGRVGARDARAQHDVAVERGEQRVEHDLPRVVGDAASAPHGQRAPAAELGEERALGAHREVRGRGRRSRRARVRAASSSARHSTASAPCADLRQHHGGFEHLGHLVAQAEPVERGDRDDDRVVALVVALAQPRLDVAAQRREHEVGPGGRELRAAAHRTGSDAPARRDRLERRADERVARVAALGNRREHEPGRRRRTGRSLAECTATSARPSSTACCTSFVNTPVPPIACRSGRWSRSPVVLINTYSTVSFSSTPSSAPTRSACQRASALARVAIRSTGYSSADGRSNSAASASA